LNTICAEISGSTFSGCRSGIFKILLPEYKIDYTGGDYNQEMLNLAKIRYPNNKYCLEDINKISFESKSFDIVFSSATIDHLGDYKKGISEIARVAGKWLIIHRLGITWRKKSIIEVLNHYNVNVYANSISSFELINEMKLLGFEMTFSLPLSKKSLNGKQGISLLFKRNS